MVMVYFRVLIFAAAAAAVAASWAQEALATDIYRSFGGTAAVSTGSGGNTLTVDNATGLATFSTARPDKMGVGDAIFYDSTGDTTPDNVCFVHARNSSTEYVCRAARGGMPTSSTAGTTSWWVYRAYNNWEDIADWRATSFNENTGFPGGWGAALKNFDNFNRIDLGASAETWHMAVYYDSAPIAGGLDNSGASGAGKGFANCTSTYYPRFFAPSGESQVGPTANQRHSGTWSATRATVAFAAYCEVANTGTCINWLFEGLQILGNASAVTDDQVTGLTFGAGMTGTGTVTIRDNIFKNFGDDNHTDPNVNNVDPAVGAAIMVQSGGPSTLTMKIYNNIFFSALGTESWGVGISLSGNSRNYVYNNTFYNQRIGLYLDDISGSGTATFHIKNNLSQSCGNDFHYYSSTTADSSATNVSSDSTSPDGASYRSKTAVFVGAGSGDFHLDTSDTFNGLSGTDLTSDVGISFSTDIDGGSRGTVWAIGADQLSAASLAITHGVGYDFGNVAKNSTDERTFTVTNSGALNATTVAENTGATLDAPYDFKGGTYPGTGGTCGATINAGASCTIVVTFNPTSAGVANETISLTYESGIGSATASRAITGTGTEVATLAITHATSYDYGNVAVSGGTLDRTFTVSNSGAGNATSLAENTGAPLGGGSAFDFKGGSFPGTGGDCTATLNAGASCTIVVTFDPSSAGAASDDIDLSYSNGVASTNVSRTVTGTGVDTAVLAIAAVTVSDYGNRVIGTGADLSFTVSNSGAGNATSVIEQVAGALAAPFDFKGGTYPGTGGTCTGTINAGASCTIVVTFTPTAAVASSDDIILSYNNGVATTSVSHTIQGTGVNGAVIALSAASSANFGNVPANTTVDRTFNVANLGTSGATALGEDGGAPLAAPFDFKGGSFPGTGGTCTANLASSATCTIVVTFAPTAAGAASDDIVLTYHDGTATTTSSLAISGTGVNTAILSVSAGTGSFGNVVLGTKVQRILTITNSGTGAATGLGTDSLSPPYGYTGGAYPGTNGDCGATLAALSSCAIEIEYAPVALGSSSTSLGLTYDNGATPIEFSESLTGHGDPDAVAPGAPSGLVVDLVPSGATDE